MIERIKRIFEEETWEQRSQRVIPAAIYAALVATIYTWTSTLVNVYFFPNLPLAVDWRGLLLRWIGLSVGTALFGAIAAWFTEEYEGIVGGGIIITLLIALFSSLFFRAQSLISILPLLGVTVLGAWAIRWVANRHIAILHENENTRRTRLLKHVGLVLLVGLIPGILGRMDSLSVQTLAHLHTLLQEAPNDPSVLPQLPLKKVPELRNHLGADYRMYARQSTVAVGTLEVTTRFSDGFAMTCLLPIGGGGMFITDCNEGDQLQLSQ